MLNGINVVVAYNKVFYVNALAARKTLCSFAGCAAYIGNFNGRAFGFNNNVSLCFGNAAGNKRHTAGSAVNGNIFKRNAQLLHFSSCKFF